MAQRKVPAGNAIVHTMLPPIISGFSLGADARSEGGQTRPPPGDSGAAITEALRP